jgi:hypothetical protein
MRSEREIKQAIKVLEKVKRGDIPDQHGNPPTEDAMVGMQLQLDAFRWVMGDENDFSKAIKGVEDHIRKLGVKV